MTFDKNGCAIDDVTTTVYVIAPETRAYIGAHDIFIPKGTGIPADSTLLRPPEPQDGFAYVLTDGAWIKTPDCRGKTYFDTQTAYPVEIKTLGTPADNLTPLTPPALKRGETLSFADNAWVVTPPSEQFQARQKYAAYQQQLATMSELGATPTQAVYDYGKALFIIAYPDRAKAIGLTK